MENNSTTVALEIFVGEWCIFQTSKSLCLGLVLNFIYLKGSKRQKQYSLDYAPVQFIAKNGTEARGIGVVATWYTWNEDGYLTNLELSDDWIKIEKYKLTLRRSPQFAGRLIFHKDQLDEIQNIKIGNIMENLMHIMSK